MAEKVLTLLTRVYYMYRNSHLNRTNLKNSFRCLSINIKLPTWAGGTRWVGHILRALEHFLDGYPVFWLYLGQLAASKEKSDGKAKVIGFLKLLRSQDINCYGTVSSRYPHCPSQSQFKISKAWIYCGISILVHKYSNQNNSAIQMAHSSRSYQNLRHPVPLQQVQQPDRLIH